MIWFACVKTNRSQSREEVVPPWFGLHVGACEFDDHSSSIHHEPEDDGQHCDNADRGRMIYSRPRAKKWARRSHIARCPVEVALTSRAAKVWCDESNPSAPRSDAVVFINVCVPLRVLPIDLHDMQPEQSSSGAVGRFLVCTLAWPTLAGGLKDIYDRPVDRS